MNLIREQRYLLLKRLDVLSANLKRETNSLRAEIILQEMRNIGELLKELVKNPVPDHEFTDLELFKVSGRIGAVSKMK